MFSLWNRFFVLLNKLKVRNLKVLKCPKFLVAMLVLIFANCNAFWGTDYIWTDKQTSGEWPASNSTKYWKKFNITWIEQSNAPSSISDNAWFTGEKHDVTVKLTSDIVINNLVFSYEGSGISSGSYSITIDLNGYNLDCENMILNNGSIGSNVNFINTNSTTPSTITTKTFDYSDNSNHKITIGENVKFKTQTYSPTTGTGSITIKASEPDSIDFPADFDSDPGYANSDSVKWNGSVSSDWTNAANWSGITELSQLTDATKITIPSGKTNYPETTQTTDVELNGKLIIEPNASISFKGNAKLNEVEAQDSSVVKFNQGSAPTTASVKNFTFNGTEIDFGKNAQNNFSYDSSTTSFSNASKIVLAGTVTAPENLTFCNSTNGGEIILAADTTLEAGNKNITIFGQIAGGEKNFTINANNFLLQTVKTDDSAPAIEKVNDFTINASFNGTNFTHINCSGDFTVNGTAQFRGNISANNFAITGDMTFGGNCLEVNTVYKQTYGSQTKLSNIEFNRETNPIFIHSQTGADLTFYSNLDSNYSTNTNPKPVKLGSINNPSTITITGAIGNTHPMDYLEINGNFTIDGKINARAIKVSGSSNLKSNIATTGLYPDETEKSQLYLGPIIINGGMTFTAANYSILFFDSINSDGTSRSLKIGNSSNKTNAIFTKDVGTVKSFEDLEFYSNVTIEDSVDLINVTNWKNSGTGTIIPGKNSTVNITGDISGNNTFNNLTIAGTAHTSSTINGSNTINKNFTCTTSGKTILFQAGKTQTVNGEFVITGSAANLLDDYITLKSSTSGSQWNINTPASTASVKFAKVYDSKSDFLITAFNSIDFGNNTNWNIASNYKWVGTSSTWNLASNWKIESGADNWISTLIFPGEYSSNDKVFIERAQENPIYSENAELILDSLSVSEETSLTWNSSKNLKIKNDFVNRGTIVYKTTGRITNNKATPTPIVDNTHGTVEFAGTNLLIDNFSSDIDYNKLIISNPSKIDNDIKTKDSLIVKATGSITGESFDLSIGSSANILGPISTSSIFVTGKSTIAANITTSGSQTFSGSTTVTTDHLEFNSTNDQTIFLADVLGTTNGTELIFTNVNFMGNANNISSLTVKGSLNLASSKNIFANKISVTGTTNNAGTISTTLSQTYNGHVENTGVINVPKVLSGTAIEFKNGLTGKGALIGAKTSSSNKEPNPDIVFSGGDVTFGTFTANDDNVKFAATFNNNFDSNNQVIKNIYFEGSTTLNSALTVDNLYLLDGTLDSQTNDITVNNDWIHTGGIFTSSSTVKIAGNVSGSNDFYKLIIAKDLTGNHKIESLTINGSSESKITGDNTIQNFICSTPSKTITFTKGSTQTIKNSLTLDGKSAGSEITLKSNSLTTLTLSDMWNINTTGATSKVQYVKIQNSNSTITIPTTLSASLGNNINWAIASTFKWCGNGTDADWKNSDNWVTLYNSSEYKTYDYPGAWGSQKIFDKAEISISSSQDKWPVFSENIESVKIEKLLLGENTKLTIAGTKDLQLTKINSPLSNSGTIIYSNSGRIKNNLTPSSCIMDTEKGTVIYNGESTVISDINIKQNSQTDEPNDYYNLQIEKPISIDGSIVVANNFNLANEKNITSLSSNNKFIVKNEASLGGNISTSDIQKYHGPVTLTYDVILSSNSEITFADNASIDGSNYNFTLDNDSSHQANFSITKNVTVKSFTANIPLNKNLSINSGTTIFAKDGFTLNDKGTISLGTSADKTQVEIKTTNNDINFLGSGIMTLNSPLMLNTDSSTGNVLINNPIKAITAKSTDLTINAGTGNIALNENIGSASIPLGTLTITGKDTTVESAKNLFVNEMSVSGEKISFKESSVINSATNILIKNKKLLQIHEGTKITAPLGFTKSDAGLSQIAGTITTSDTDILFNTDTYIYGELTFDTTNAGTNTTKTAKITIGTNDSPANLFISAIKNDTAQTVKFISSTIDVNKNIALFNGNVTLNANLTADKDIVLLNGIAATMYDDDKTPNVSSFTKKLFDYHNPLRTKENLLCEPSLIFYDTTTGAPTASGFPELMPDETTAIDHTKYSSTLTGFEEKTITANQNFYDNGVDLIPSSQWTLKLKDNDSAINSFAELYKAQIANCKVECITSDGYAWLSASEAIDKNGNKDDTNATLTYIGDNAGTYTRTKTGVAFLYPVLLKNNSLYSASEGRKTGPEIPNLSGTYSVRDNVIRVEFVRNNNQTKTALIENSNNEISRALKAIKLNGGNSLIKSETYIDAECTVSTDNKGDLAVFYIKADSIKWNLTATGTSSGDSADYDSDGNHQTNTTDISIQRVMDDLFYTLTDEHKNRIASYTALPTETPNSKPGFRFTATETRCVIGEMHITFAIADFNSNKIYLYFDNPLADNITWKTFYPETEDSKKTESSIKIIASPNAASYEPLIVESVSREGISSNGIILSLNNNLTYDMIEHGLIIKYGGTFLFNNKIHSPDNKVVLDGESHCISDVITNCIDVQYAYDNRNDAYIESTGGIAPADSIAMRDFTGDGRNNKVFADKNITLVTKDISNNLSQNNNVQFKYKLIADLTPTLHSDGELFQNYTGHKTRFWFAQGTTPVSSFSSTLNSSPNKKDSILNSDLITQTIDSSDPTKINYYFHNFSEENPCLNWQSGSHVQFLFEVLKQDGTPYTINHKYDAAATQSTPLYLARLKNLSDPTSIDLWSFKIAEPQRQRGGVSIYSNVVNATTKEFCTLEINMTKAGSLRAIVMTADGNVVTYLENGFKTEGLHYYYWNGTNNSGREVARGIYFIRVVGPDIDETRKVMVVK